MSPTGRFTGNAYGAVNANIKDQCASALAGDQVYANDIMNVDSRIIGESAGIFFGAGVAKTNVAAIWTAGAYPVSGPPKRPAASQWAATLPTVASALADFDGILLRSAAGQSDANGAGFLPYKSVGAVARKLRAGARVWVPCYCSALPALTDTIYWITSDTTKTAGFFSNAAGGITSTVSLATIAKIIGAMDYNAVTGMCLLAIEITDAV